MKRISFPTLLLLFASLLLPSQGKNCGFSDFQIFSLVFDRDLVFENGSSLKSYNMWNYDKYKHGDGPMSLLNTTEWAEFFEQKYTPEDLVSTIYRTHSFKSFNTELKELREKRMINLNIDKKEISFINYLKLSLAVENHLDTYVENPWTETKVVIDQNEYSRLIDECQKMISSTEFQFIKERTAYQLLKLYRYNKKFDQVEICYNQYFKYSKSFISYWAMEHFAGALRSMGRKAEANYYFSKVYANSPSRQKSAYLSINISNNEELEEVKSLCETIDEKMALHFIRGINDRVLGIDDIDFIVQSAGDHEYARLLMSREIRKLEVGFGTASNSATDDNNTNFYNLAYLKSLLELNKKIVKQSAHSKFWDLSLAYLYYLNDDYTESMNALGDLPDSEGELKQYYVIYILSYLGTKDELSIAEENQLGKILYLINDKHETLTSVEVKDPVNSSNLRMYDYFYRQGGEERNDINRHIFSKIFEKIKDKNIYKKLIFNGENIRWDLFRREVIDFKNNYWLQQKDVEELSLEYIDNLLEAYYKTPKTALVKFAGIYYFGAKSWFNKYDRLIDNYDDIQYVLKDMKGSLLMRDPNTLSKAIETFSEIPRGKQKTFYSNPFEFSVSNPVINIEQYNYEHSNTKLNLAKKMKDLYSENDTKRKGRSLLKLANIYYNLSYYGSSWDYLAYYRSSTEPNGFCNNQVVMTLIERAIEAGLPNRNDEAKAYFLKARCEQNMYCQKHEQYDFSDSSLDYQLGVMKRRGHQQNFDKIASDYKNTSFYNEIISECKYFRYYVLNQD